VVALLANSSFEVILTFFALNRLGYAIFFLSTRLAGPAYARLLKMANCQQLIIAKHYGHTLHGIRKYIPSCCSLPILQRSDWFNLKASPARFKRSGVISSQEGKKIAWILHSSGSTGSPKPIFLTNFQTLANFRKSFGFSLFNISPLFHSHALMQLGRAFYTRATSYLGNHSLPVTYQNLFDALEAAQPQQISAVPYVIKLLAEKPEGIQILAKARLVLYGGSCFPEDLGDRLVAQGVNLAGNYGATETGQIMTSFRPPSDTEWQYMRLHSPALRYTLMDEISPGIFECVALDGLSSKSPSNSKPPFSERNPKKSFRTADLFTRHPNPQKNNYYRYLCRLDDRITLVNGEKVLPIPIEGRVREDNLVRECVVFGLRRTMPGALIFRAADSASHLSDKQFLELIWPTVEAANARAETFSRISKELIVVKGADVVYPRTDKGTFIRPQVYRQFAQDIESAYASFEGSSQKRGQLALSILELERWLLCRFRKDLGVLLSNAEADIFSAGVDSLQATQIRRSIVRELDLGDCGVELSQNIVFEEGTVKALAKNLYHRRTGQKIQSENEIQLMQDMIEKYSHFIQHHPTLNKQPDGELVLVTGATGNLGAFIVSELLKRPTVSEVWALVRAPGQAEATARLLKALADRKINLTDEEALKLRAIPSDLSQPDLGLDPCTLEGLLSSLTCVIHSAWAVNFTLGVRSFERHHICGTHNLINFCLRSKLHTPARFFFCSSVSVASNTPKPASIPESVIENLGYASELGYGRSKLVTEHITRNAMRQTGMQARVLRIGQLSGDTVSAQWNDTEALPLMFRSALTIGALPELNESLSWLPVNKCAQAIADIAMQRAATPKDIDLVYNIVNPKSFSWKTDLLPSLKQDSALPAFQLVPPQEWLQRLTSSEQDPEKNPSIKLVEFWRLKYAGHRNQKEDEDCTEERHAEDLTFETDRTLQICPFLAFIKDPVTEGLIQRCIENWMKKWT
jgi:thioester reductase-like protein